MKVEAVNDEDGRWTKVTTEIPMGVTVTLTDDLPNGPYGEVGHGGISLHLPKSEPIAYANAKEQLLKVWNNSRGQVQVGRTNLYKEESGLQSLTFKGGEVKDEDFAQEGVHNATIASHQYTKKKQKQSCCAVQ